MFLFYSDAPGNEWKTRFETQIELNGQLERQISLIHERLEDLQGNPMGRFTGHCQILSTFAGLDLKLKTYMTQLRATLAGSPSM